MIGPFASALLYFHIALGGIALLSGMLVMCMTKGTRLHVRAGRIYFWCMCLVCASALSLCILHPNTFLALIAVFSFYSCYTGRQAARRKDTYPRPLDWLLLGVMAATGIMMVLSGKPVLMVLSLISFRITWTDLRLYRGKRESGAIDWKLRHIGNMTGSYIATVTAFLVNTVHFSYPVIGWLTPTAVGVPLIVYWIIKEKRKLQPSV